MHNPNINSNNIQYNTLLIELLTEELPPKALKSLSIAFAENILSALVNLKLVNINAKLNSKIFATPRRLGVSIPDVLAYAPKQEITTRLMPLKLAMHNNLPTPALIKKLQSLDLDINLYLDKLNVINDGKQDYIQITYTAKPISLEQELNKILQETISKLPVPKIMTYQLANGESVKFVRPAHSLICLHGNKIIDAHILGLKSSNTTQGHRFLSEKKILTINQADDYEKILLEHKVIVNYDLRLEKIKSQLEKNAQQVKAEVLMPLSLLEEVNSLVEYPCVYKGEFDKKFLNIPQECLVLAMQTHQKYFALKCGENLINEFLFVSNMEVSNPQNIIAGNEKVIRPRLADAQFFYDEDKKHTLQSRVADLDKIIYHNKLGSQLKRCKRIAKIILNISEQNEPQFNTYEIATQSTKVCKADLLTNMVGEFPELQGIMGYYYAQHDGLDEKIALAIKEHYKPRFAGDELPQGIPSIILALADKLETLVGMWGIGLKPTGEKDPYALRRHTLGILRILIELKLNLNLKKLIIDTSTVFEKDNNLKDYKPCVEEIYNFCIERLENYLQKNTQFEKTVIEAVLHNNYLNNSIIIFPNLNSRLAVAKSFLTNYPQLIALNKRVHNIIKNYLPLAQQFILDEKLLSVEAEKNLHQAFLHIKNNNLENTIFNPYEIINLAKPLADFFDNVMVNDENEAIRNNRIALLIEIAKFCNQDFCIAKL